MEKQQAIQALRKEMEAFFDHNTFKGDYDGRISARMECDLLPQAALIGWTQNSPPSMMQTERRCLNSVTKRNSQSKSNTDMANFTAEWERIRENRLTILALEKSNKKIDRLAAHLLGGYAVTGRKMIESFNIYSYRDAIHNLVKKNYDIKRKVVVSPNKVEHVVWWLGEFSEEFVKTRNPEMFR